MKHTQTLRIEHAQQGAYLRLPFTLPEGAERVDVSISYPRAALAEAGGFVYAREACVLDLALESPDGRLIGAAGSDRTHVFVSPLGSAEGFASMELEAGVWRVVIGAYQVPQGGVDAACDIEIAQKRRRLFRGDTHAHTVASDGAFSLGTLVEIARGEQLDFLFVTDHNNVSAPPRYEGLTVLPGVEWTHFQGHAGFLGSAAPLQGRYDTESLEETRLMMERARERGALVVLNHPFCPLVPWKWGFEVPFDALEVWNGVMSERNERAVGFWHARLCAGARIPAVGGSDYHRPGLLGSLAMPCMCLYAPSRSQEDLLAALRRGEGFVSYLPDGPTADARCERENGAVSFGGSAPPGAAVTFSFHNLQGGDEIRLITDADTERIACPPDAAAYTVERRYDAARFVRAELSRVYAPGLPPMKALLTNPIYFD